MEEQIEKILKGLKIKEDEDYSCPKCKDTGYIVVDGIAKKCNCYRGKKSLPSKFSNVKLKDFNLEFYPDIVIDPQKGRDSYLEKAQKVLSSSKNLVKSLKAGKKSKGLFIEGPVGSGKTHLVSGIYNELFESGVEVSFFVVPELLEQSKADIFSNGEGKDIFNKARKIEVLILDDLGAHNYTPWSINQLYSLINYRVNNELTTIITTNLNPMEIDNFLDQRIASRITDICLIHNLPVDRDIRAKKKKITKKCFIEVD